MYEEYGRASPWGVDYQTKQKGSYQGCDWLRVQDIGLGIAVSGDMRGRRNLWFFLWPSRIRLLICRLPGKEDQNSYNRNPAFEVWSLLESLLPAQDLGSRV